MSKVPSGKVSITEDPVRRERLIERLEKYLSSPGSLQTAAVEVLKKFDKDGDGIMSYAEIEGFLRDMSYAIGTMPYNNARINQLLTRFDHDDSGVHLTKNQWVELYRRVVVNTLDDLKRSDTRSIGTLADRSKYVHTRRLKQGESIQQYYRFKRILGKGGFGSAHEVVDLETGQRRCMKVIKRTKDSPEPLGPGGFEYEIKIMKSLDHPHVCKIFDVFQDKDSVYIIMEIARGGKVSTHISSTFTESDHAYYYRQILQTLLYCHARNIIHKDLKFDNVLLADDENVKVIDWGLAEIAPSGKNLGGTPGFIAPEAFSGRLGLKGDIFSVGAMMYISVTGVLPYGLTPSSDPHWFVPQRATGVDPYNRLAKAEISSNMKVIIKTMLQWDPKHRPGAAECLHHTFFSESASVIDNKNTDISKNILTSLIKTANDGALSAAIRNVLCHELDINNSDVKRAIESFKALDKDNSGTLSRNEISNGLVTAGWKSSNIDALLKVLDQDGNNEITCSEFVAACKSWTVKESATLYKAFKNIDTDGNGFLSPNEFEKLLYGGRFGDSKDVRKLIRKIDTNQDGQICWTEFQDYVLREY